MHEGVSSIKVGRASTREAGHRNFFAGHTKAGQRTWISLGCRASDPFPSSPVGVTDGLSAEKWWEKRGETDEWWRKKMMADTRNQSQVQGSRPQWSKIIDPGLANHAESSRSSSICCGVCLKNRDGFLILFHLDRASSHEGINRLGPLLVEFSIRAGLKSFHWAISLLGLLGTRSRLPR
ncbi:hypothetical protein Droror1_Dr00001611 [Drosera rotundifolia]